MKYVVSIKTVELKPDTLNNRIFYSYDNRFHFRRHDSWIYNLITKYKIEEMTLQCYHLQSLTVNPKRIKKLSDLDKFDVNEFFLHSSNVNIQTDHS